MTFVASVLFVFPIYPFSVVIVIEYATFKRGIRLINTSSVSALNSVQRDVQVHFFCQVIQVITNNIRGACMIKIN